MPFTSASSPTPTSSTRSTRDPRAIPKTPSRSSRPSERLTAARDALNALRPALDLVFLVGDYFHDYPSADLDFYFKNTTRIDRAKALTDGFRMPVHVGFGNHDYAVPKVSREASHELFRRKLGVKPYYAVDHRGWKFIHVNNFLGTTWEAGHANYQQAARQPRRRATELARGAAARSASRRSCSCTSRCSVDRADRGRRSRPALAAEAPRRRPCSASSRATGIAGWTSARSTARRTW